MSEELSTEEIIRGIEEEVVQAPPPRPPGAGDEVVRDRLKRERPRCLLQIFTGVAGLLLCLPGSYLLLGLTRFWYAYFQWYSSNSRNSAEADEGLRYLFFSSGGVVLGLIGIIISAVFLARGIRRLMENSRAFAGLKRP
jgi:hypothetical protein